MGVSFVNRRHYEGASGRHVPKLDADSVLGWSQQVREPAKPAEDAFEWVKSETGASVGRKSSSLEAPSRSWIKPATGSERDHPCTSWNAWPRPSSHTGRII